MIDVLCLGTFIVFSFFFLKVNTRLLGQETLEILQCMSYTYRDVRKNG